MQVATCDLKVNKYLRDKTSYDIDIFSSYFQRIDKIIRKGKITTASQFYDVKLLRDDLVISESLDNEKNTNTSHSFDYRLCPQNLKGIKTNAQHVENSRIRRKYQPRQQGS